MPLLARPVFALIGSFSILAVTLVIPVAGQSAKTTTGEALFAQRCAGCHGAKGEGGKAYPQQLSGTLSVHELSGFIHKSMPPGPQKCPTAGADKIAAFMFQSFFSPAAQARNRVVRVRLYRLTDRQFRNAVADLIGNSQAATPDIPPSGLNGEYFKGRNFDGKERVLARVDPEVNFNFGAAAPTSKGIDPYNFSISWEGSILAPDTGEYEFVIHSDQAVRMWLNDDHKLLIDGFVRSAKHDDFRGVATLLGGRAYHVRLEFSKATQGVDDQKKKTTPVPPASISLRWRRPNHTEETIPSFCLYPQWSPQKFVVTTPMPPDDRSMGYEVGDAISKDWDDATTNAALEAARYVATHIQAVTGVPDDAKDRRQRLMDYCGNFVERAFRRPLSGETRQLYVDKQFSVAPDVETALKRVVVLTLKSPQFLYREIGGGNHDGYAVASQLSFTLWDSIPDPELQQAAAKGELITPEQVERQAERMTDSPRTWNKLREFLLHWLKLDEVPDIVKNPAHYPGFDQAAVSDLRTSLELFLQNTAWSHDSDYRQVMLSHTQYLNGDLGKLYGANLPLTASFQPIELDGGSRCGIVTQPYLLARFAYLDGSSPIHRGVLIYRNLLGRILNPPPANFVPLAASAHPDFTTRERVALQTKPPFCTSCHGIVNPLGYTLEEYDAIGRRRTTDNNKPVDTTGSYLARNGKVEKFGSAKDLAEYLANSDDAHQAFVQKLFLHEAKQPPMAYGTKTLANLQQQFAKNQYSIRKLVAAIAVATALPQARR